MIEAPNENNGKMPFLRIDIDEHGKATYLVSQDASRYVEISAEVYRDLAAMQTCETMRAAEDLLDNLSVGNLSDLIEAALERIIAEAE